MAENPTTNTGDPAQAGDGTTQPTVTKSGKVKTRAFKNDIQLGNFVKGLVEENRERNIKNARIMAKYNAERPYEPGALAAEGLLWKSNFSTQPLATLIDRIAPRFTRAIDSVRYLTCASLPERIQDANKKTELFRRKFTEMCRNRVGWNELTAEISQENSLFGYTATANLDDTSWFPKHYRQDDFFVQALTKQNAAFAPSSVFREAFLPHELFELIEDTDSAKEAGWDIKNTVEAINSAMPDDLRSTTSDDARRYEDLSREANMYASNATGAKVIVAFHVLVAETTGKISHYIVDGKSWKTLFKRLDQFESMDDSVNFYSFQQANGKLMASKGVGRTLYMLAGAVDRSRNEIVDRFQLSGKMILQGEEKDIRSFKMSVIGNAVLISKALTVATGKIDAGISEFKDLDLFVRSIMDEISGNVSAAGVSEQMQGERVTNGQVNFIADLQNEGKDAKISRFLTHFSAMVTRMQRRATSTAVSDQDAKDFRAECLAIMSEEEFEYLGKQPSSRTVDDLTDVQRQIIITICSEVAGNPLVNQKEALRRKLTAAVNEEFAQALMIDDEDPTIVAEQTRLQQMETVAIKTGEDLAVSPRDNDLIHLEVLMPQLEKVATAVAGDPAIAEVLKLLNEHAYDHIQSAVSKKVDPGKLQAYLDTVTKVQAGLKQLAAVAEQQAQVEAQASGDPAAVGAAPAGPATQIAA